MLKSIFNSFKRIKFEKKFGKQAFSQEGEDVLLQRFFKNQDKGVFIDVGAHHPIKISNTYFFYKMGWRGINIDASPLCIDLFNQIRSKDINILAGVSQTSEVLNYYCFRSPEMNTFSEEVAKQFEQKNSWNKIIDVKQVKTERLDSILDRNIKNIPFYKGEIDFLNVDVEGYDLQVLKSNNWDLYRPKYILVEDLFQRIENTFESELTNFLRDKGYELIGKLYNTAIYKEKNHDYSFS